MKVQLVVVRGKPEGKVIPLVGPKFKIGRGETCHLRPNSEQVSREHAEFTINADSVLVRDLGSRFGTQLNGHKVVEAVLKDGDEIKAGRTVFTVALVGPPPGFQSLQGALVKRQGPIQLPGIPVG